MEQVAYKFILNKTNNTNREIAQGEVWVFVSPRAIFSDSKIFFEYGDTLPKERTYNILKNGEQIIIQQITKLGDPRNEIVIYKIFNNNGKAEITEIYKGLEHKNIVDLVDKHSEKTTTTNVKWIWLVGGGMLFFTIIAFIIIINTKGFKEFKRRKR